MKNERKKKNEQECRMNCHEAMSYAIKIIIKKINHNSQVEAYKLGAPEAGLWTADSDTSIAIDSRWKKVS